MACLFLTSHGCTYATLIFSLTTSFAVNSTNPCKFVAGSTTTCQTAPWPLSQGWVVTGCLPALWSLPLSEALKSTFGNMSLSKLDIFLLFKSLPLIWIKIELLKLTNARPNFRTSYCDNLWPFLLLTSECNYLFILWYVLLCSVDFTKVPSSSFGILIHTHPEKFI